MQIRRSTLDFYLVERTEDERQSPRYLYLGGIDDGREEKLLIFAAISRIPRLRVIEGARGFALADRRETRAKTFSPANGKLSFACVISYRDKLETRGVKKAYVAFVLARETHRVCNRVFARPIHVSSVSLRTYLPT